MGGYEFAGQYQLHRHRLADGANQTLSAACAGNNAKIDFRLTKLGIVTGNHDVGMHDQFAAAAECKAVYGCNQGLGELSDATPVQHARVVQYAHGVKCRHLLDVSTCCKDLFIAGDNDSTDAVIVSTRLEHIRQLAEQLRAQCVVGFRTVEGDGQYAIYDLRNKNVLILVLHRITVICVLLFYAPVKGGRLPGASAIVATIMGPAACTYVYYSDSARRPTVGARLT